MFATERNMTLALQEDLNRIIELSHTWQFPMSYNKCCIFDLF